MIKYFKNSEIHSFLVNYFFTSPPKKILIFSFGIVISGVSAVWLGQLFANQISYNFLYFSLLAWIYIRIVDLLCVLWKKADVHQAIVFSYAYFFPIFIILFLGFFRIKLHLHILSILSFLDLVIVLGICVFRSFKKTLFNIFLGFLFGGAMILITVLVNGYFPWLETSSFARIGYIDDFRDAAIAQSWSNYRAISHGIHGLLYYPYHSLSVLFSTPFISEKLSIFEFFTYSSYIFTPTILSYGVWSILRTTGSKHTKTYLPIIFFCFFFLFIGFNYIFNQRSVQIASLLYVSAVPLLIVVWTYPKENTMAFALLALLIPLIFFARIFHGLILAAATFPLIINPLTRVVPKIILAISAITTLMILFLIYGADPRTAGLRPENIIFSLVHYKFMYLIEPVILFLVMLITGKFLLRGKKNFLGYFTQNESRIGIFLLIVTTSPFFFSIKGIGYSDVFYTFLPAFFIFYILIFSEGFFKLLHNLAIKITANISIEIERKLWKPDIKKLFILLIFLICVINYWGHLKQPGGLVLEMKSWRTMLGKWKPSGDNPIFFEDLNLIKNCSSSAFDPFCSIRAKILGSSDLNDAARNSLASRMGKKAKDLAAQSEGVTGIYIHPNHEYWLSKYSSQEKSAIYFMARWGIPMIAGAIPGKDLDFSLPTARKNDGTLLSLLEIGGIKGLCSKASKVGVSNVVVFLNLEGVNANFYNCSLV
jgi:hypothetical protein